MIIAFERFFRSKGPTDFGRNSQHGEKLASDRQSLQSFRFVAARQENVEKISASIRPSIICGNFLKRLASLLPVKKIGRGADTCIIVPAPGLTGLPELDESIRI